MSIYNKENKFFELIKRSKKPIFIATSIFLIIIILFLIISSINWSKLFDIKGNNISIKFKNNPLNLSKNINTMMYITIKNNSKIDAVDSIVSINPVENNFTIFCENHIKNKESSVRIPIISKGNKRTINCDVRVDPTKNILDGSYSFDINYILNKEVFSKRVTLNIKKE